MFSIKGDHITNFEEGGIVGCHKWKHAENVIIRKDMKRMLVQSENFIFSLKKTNRFLQNNYICRQISLQIRGVVARPGHRAISRCAPIRCHMKEKDL